MKFPAFDYESPTSLSEAVALLADHGDEAMLLAGGQRLMPILAFRMAAPALLVDLNNVRAPYWTVRGAPAAVRGDAAHCALPNS